MFYGGHIQVHNDNRVENMIYFVSPTIATGLRAINQERGFIDLHMDGTFRVVPRAGGAYQLFLIHIMFEGHVSILNKLMKAKVLSLRIIFRFFRFAMC